MKVGRHKTNRRESGLPPQVGEVSAQESHSHFTKMTGYSFMIAGLMLLAGCASPPANLVGLGESQIPQFVAQGASVQNLFVATSRARSEDDAEFFSGKRASELGLANVNVTIPRNHRVGKIERPKAKRISKSDIAKHFTIGRPLLFEDSPSFQANLNQALAQRPPGERSVLVFVHGYNTNFSTAVLRVSQFVHDTGYKGVPVLFTWASRGRKLDYFYDINSALQARSHLVELTSILGDSEAECFSVVAHSMGNLVALEAMAACVKTGFSPKAPLNSLILAAPDVDFDLFTEQMQVLKPIKEKIFVLVSKSDQALILSKTIAGGVIRVGSTDPEKLAALGINVVDLSKINDKSSANHSKFARSPKIVQLIGRGINSGNTLSAINTTPTESSIGSVFREFKEAPSRLVDEPNGRVLTPGN